MNDSIKRVALAIVLLFGLLLVFTSRWTVFEADQLQSNSLNKLPLLREQQQPRGRIVARDRHLIARSVQRGRGGQATYLRRYAPPTLYAHPVGYYDVELRSTGLERYYDDQLSNNREELLTLLDQLLARKSEGRDMTTALDPVAQQLAGAQLAGRAGAVVVIEPATGRVPVYVSSPSYNQNLIRNPAAFAALNKSDKKVLFDRVGQAAYPPGSTFKVVTAAAALDQALYDPNSVLNGNSPQTFSGQPLSNSGGKSWGDISLTTALTHSVNTVWAQVGEKLGNQTLFDYMQRFGFGAKPPIDLPPDELTTSGVRSSGGRLLNANDGVDLGRVAIGQERLFVTPLQMATVAATIANGGVRMEPRLARLFRDADGRIVKTIPPKVATRAISKSTADQLTKMMTRVVDEGTGTAAQLAGFSVAGKTGTAEVDGGRANQAWFIAFAPVDRPRYAIAVTVERTTGEGGTIAAPIARSVLESLLQR